MSTTKSAGIATGVTGLFDNPKFAPCRCGSTNIRFFYKTYENGEVSSYPGVKCNDCGFTTEEGTTEQIAGWTWNQQNRINEWRHEMQPCVCGCTDYKIYNSSSSTRVLKCANPECPNCVTIYHGYGSWKDLCEVLVEFNNETNEKRFNIELYDELTKRLTVLLTTIDKI